MKEYKVSWQGHENECNAVFKRYSPYTNPDEDEYTKQIAEEFGAEVYEGCKTWWVFMSHVMIVENKGVNGNQQWFYKIEVKESKPTFHAKEIDDGDRYAQ